MRSKPVTNNTEERSLFGLWKSSEGVSNVCKTLSAIVET
jgi:hypothetical protein